MTNKYKVVRDVLPRQAEKPSKLPVLKPTQGFRSDVSPRDMPLEASPDLNDVSFERGAIRKEFGWVSVGTAATQKILALGEYKIIFGGALTQRTFRVWRDVATGLAKVDTWNGALWSLFATSTTQINSVYLSMAAIQNILALADGKQVLRLSEIAEPTDLKFDFPPLNQPNNLGEFVELTVSGIVGEISQTGVIKFRVTFNGSANTTIKLGFYVNNVLAKAVSLSYVTGIDPDPNVREEIVEVIRSNWANNDVVKIKIDEQFGGVPRTDSVPVGGSMGVDNPGGPPPAAFQVNKSAIPASVGNVYSFKINVGLAGLPTGDTITIGIYTTINGGTNWTKQGANVIITEGTEQTVQRTIPDLEASGPSVKFGINREAATNAGTYPVNYDVIYNESNAVVKGYNRAVDADPDSGLILQESVQQLKFEPIVGAPAGRYVFSFDDRLVVLQDGIDAQAFSWSVGGNVLDFSDIDSGKIFLVSPRIDSIDALMCGAPLAANMAALIRQRSIMRVFPSGNVLQALGAVPWIEGIGTEARFSLQIVLGGVMFLGHDFMVYYLTEGGTRPVGLFIQQELLERLANSDLELVDSMYDVALGRYILAIPEDGATQITALWLFDLKRFLATQEPVWWRRTVTAQRLGWTSKVL